MATFENRSIVVSDTEGNNAVVTPAGELKVSSDLVGINGNTPQTLPGSPGQLLVAVEGPANAGTSITGNPVIMGGYDGANGQFVRVDTLGRQQVVGAAADGAAVAGNPVLMGGQDGANVQSFLTDASGRQQINNAQWLGSSAPTVGQKVMADSLPVTLASDQSTLPISAASLPLPTGAATAANQTNGAQLTRITDGTDTANVTAAGALQVDGSGVTQPISAASLPLPTGAATEATLATRTAAAQLPAALVGGRLDANIGAWLGSTAPTVGQKTSANSIPVTLASDQPAIPVSSTPSASTASAVTQVAGSLVVVTLKAANAARKGLTLYNEGNQPWYVKLGAAATLTSFTVKILRDGYYEVPFGYTGIVTGIQAVSSSSLYVTELT